VDTDIVAVEDAAQPAETTESAGGTTSATGSDSTGGTAIATPGKRRSTKIAITGLALVALAAAGVAGFYGPRLVNQFATPSYTGDSAASVAEDLGCTEYKQATTHDESVYQYHDQGTCVFNGTRVRITTFDEAVDGDAFLTLMNGLIPVLHPTWVGAATAAGEGWNVADATNLSPKVAEAAVVKLGAGEVRVIPSAQRA
jgi:hypothetical protein